MIYSYFILCDFSYYKEEEIYDFNLTSNLNETIKIFKDARVSSEFFIIE